MNINSKYKESLKNKPPISIMPIGENKFYLFSVSAWQGPDQTLRVYCLIEI